MISQDTWVAIGIFASVAALLSIYLVSLCPNSRTRPWIRVVGFVTFTCIAAAMGIALGALVLAIAGECNVQIQR